jgi:hypothetical protein
MSPAGHWWGNLGFPNSTGSQNGTSYAIFNNIRRLAINQNGKVTVFDTLDNNIGGVGQQQGGNYSVTFTSQYGTVDLSSLPIVSGGDNIPKPQPPVQQNNVIQNEQAPIAEPIQDPLPMQAVSNTNTSAFEEDIFGKIEKLAGLKDKGILSVDEFNNKKADLLNRL